MGLRTPTVLKPDSEVVDGLFAITFQGETAYYTRAELEMLRAMKPTKENENAARFIHAAKVHLDATLVE